MKLKVTHESWPIAGSFTIARGSKTAADVMVVELEAQGVQGRGEAVPYARYGETMASAMEALERHRAAIEHGMSRAAAQALLLPKSATNALDCALWDVEAKLAGRPAWQLAGLAAPKPLTTAFTLSLDRPEAMASVAAKNAARPLLKLKLGADGDAGRLALIRKAAPAARLIVDANEGWTTANVEEMLNHCQSADVELVEQPLPADSDEMLSHITRSVPVCADESAHGVESLARLQGKYDAINIKLDKTGGLTPALELAEAAKAHGFQIMVGCMLATSLAMAPALLVAQYASVIDLDGPLLLAKDRIPGLTYDMSSIHPAPPSLWG